MCEVCATVTTSTVYRTLLVRVRGFTDSTVRTVMVIHNLAPLIALILPLEWARKSAVSLTRLELQMHNSVLRLALAHALRLT